MTVVSLVNVPVPAIRVTMVVLTVIIATVGSTKMAAAESVTTTMTTAKTSTDSATVTESTTFTTKVLTTAIEAPLALPQAAATPTLADGSAPAFKVVIYTVFPKRAAAYVSSVYARVFRHPAQPTL
ncbi:hypothetical protein MN608_06003 [Microdochium nivale]|nr:hypothetical protein MN608_06003 [Microdochium nivale]